MHSTTLLILFVLPLIMAFPQDTDYESDRALETYLDKRMQQLKRDDTDDQSSEDSLFDQRRALFSKLLERQRRRMILECLPNGWTCSPGLAPCCQGSMCYEGNAKRGRVCVARG